jgi:hypothetical protein
MRTQLFKIQESTRASSIVSSTTDTSSDTVTGLGSISGRVVLGLGEVILRGLDNLVILQKLEVIKSAFPHDDNTVPDNIGTLYDNVLELSRYVAIHILEEQR